jgi:segregation and condensation protein B
MSHLSCTIESILYLKAQPLTVMELAELAGCDRDEAEEGLLELMADFSHRDTSLEVAEIEGCYVLQLRTDYQGMVQRIIPADIGVGALRTLAVIAMKGPLLQTDLINLRGSTAYQQVQELVEQGFVRKRRRSDGRSYWLQVTEKFRQYFQLNQLQTGFDPFAKAQAEAALAADREVEPEVAEMIPEEGEIPEVIEGVLSDDRLMEEEVFEEEGRDGDLDAGE